MYNIYCRFPIIRYFLVEIIHCFIFQIGVLCNAVLISAVQWSAVQSAIQFSSVVQSCLTLCDTMDCSMPGFAVLHHFPELAQTHELVMPSNHLILCCSLLFLPLIFPRIRVFSNESTLRMRWPKYWSFSLSVIPSKEHPGQSPLEWTGWISLKSKGLSRVFFNTTVQNHRFFSAQLSSQSNSHIHTWPLEKP